MIIIKQSWEWLSKPIDAEQMIEIAGRNCYMSQDKITSNSSPKFCKMLIERGHEAMLEHVTAGIKIITNRGVSHELCRHRTGIAFAQESSRYVNYGGKEIAFIEPVWWEESSELHKELFINLITSSELTYKELLKSGWKPEQAREVLPNALKTSIVVTANIREWRHIFKLRTSKNAHPQMRALMLDILNSFYKDMPSLFEDIVNNNKQ